MSEFSTPAKPHTSSPGPDVSWTVAKLRRACRDAGLRTSGRKAKLLHRLQTIQRSNSAAATLAQDSPLSSVEAQPEANNEDAAIEEKKVSAVGGTNVSPLQQQSSIVDEPNSDESPQHDLTPTPGATRPAKPPPLQLHSIDDYTTDNSCAQNTETEENKVEDSSTTVHSSMPRPSSANSILGSPLLTSLNNLVARAREQKILPRTELHNLSRRLSRARRVLVSNIKAKEVDIEALGTWMAHTRARLSHSITASMADVYPFWSFEYLSRLLVAIVLFFATGYINAVSAATAGWRTPHIQILDYPDGKVVEGRYILPDLGLDMVQYAAEKILPVEWTNSDGCFHWTEGPDVILQIHVALAVFLIVISPQRFKIIRRLFLIFAILNLLRAFTVIVTSLPDASPKCAQQWTDPKTGAYKARPIFPANLWRAFKVLQFHTTCGDMVFSGHATVMLLIMKAYTEYFHTTRLCYRLSDTVTWCGRAAVRILTSLGLLMVLFTKMHYTLDIAIAVYLNLRIWDAYHINARTVSLRSRTGDLLQRAFLWFEDEGVIGLEHQVYVHGDHPFVGFDRV